VTLIELFFLAVFFYAVFFILGGLGKILGLNPLFLGIPAILVGLGLIIIKSKNWALAVIVGISFGIGLYLVGRLGIPQGIAGVAAMAMVATLPAVFVFGWLIILIALVLKIVAWINRLINRDRT
jgi:hypothetical protein